jgi:copper chaperone CopZ
MTHQYLVKGMTCGGCVANVKKALESVPGVTSVEVKRETSNATVTMNHHIDTVTLQKAVKQYGNYELSDFHQ